MHELKRVRERQVRQLTNCVLGSHSARRSIGRFQTSPKRRKVGTREVSASRRTRSGACTGAVDRYWISLQILSVCPRNGLSIGVGAIWRRRPRRRCSPGRAATSARRASLRASSSRTFDLDADWSARERTGPCPRPSLSLTAEAKSVGHPRNAPLASAVRRARDRVR